MDQEWHNRTEYVYAADGTRLKKIDKAGTAGETETWYFGPVEIREPDTASEVVMTYPQDYVRTRNGVVSYLYRDQLSSIKLIADASGGEDVERIYQPFGAMEEFVLDASAPEEDQGWIGEYFDKDAGLQYLNARYYDPELSMFIQPDWLDVREPGVGTNRYAYSFNDPVNLSDPGGNGVPVAVAYGVVAIAEYFGVTGIFGLSVAQTTVVVGAAAVGTAVVVSQIEADEERSRPNIDPERAGHILGGHRHGSGKPGKTEFPEEWTDSDILDGVSEVGLNGEETDVPTDRVDDFTVRGEYKGIEIEVVVDGETGKIRTGYPTAGQKDKGVNENPDEDGE